MHGVITSYTVVIIERTGLTVLDVVKHAVRTVVTSMQALDRVSIVTFSASSKVCSGRFSSEE